MRITSSSQFPSPLPQIKACAANGKHVFCEKPIATDVPETIEAINACKQANVKLMTALQRRFDPNFARVKVAIADGEVGELIQVRCACYFFNLKVSSLVRDFSYMLFECSKLCILFVLSRFLYASASSRLLLLPPFPPLSPASSVCCRYFGCRGCVHSRTRRNLTGRFITMKRFARRH